MLDKMQSHKDAQDLWLRAFGQLGAKETEILKKVERERAELNKILIDEALYKEKKKQWCISLAGKSLKIRELGADIVDFVNSSQQYISQVASVEPHAALAWTCVSLLLPMITNQRSQEEAMLAGLDEVSHLIRFYSPWHSLYAAAGSDELQESVVCLYTAILSYQARMLHHLSRGNTKNFARNAFKRDAWDAWLDEVRLRHEQCGEHGRLQDISRERQDRSFQASVLETQAETTKHILDALHDLNQQTLRQVSEGERDELIRCFSSDYRGQKDTNPQRVEGTCEWFVQDDKFTGWRNSRTSCLLHVFAGPGCGKSVLFRHLVDSGSLKSSDNSTVLYFFFKAGQQGRERSSDAVAAMLHQLYTQKHGEAMIVHALQKFKNFGDRLPAMFEQLWDILRETVKDPRAGEIVCVLDALDECLEGDRGRLLTTITTYLENSAPLNTAGGRIKFLITSRPYEDISGEYSCVKVGSPVVQLDGNDKILLIAQEINLVIESAVKRSITRVSEDVQRGVVEQLQRMNNRTYLWLHLVLDFVKENIAGNRTPKKIQKLISTLPPTVNDAYAAMLRRSTNLEKARRLLHLVVAAKRPLTVSELKIAAALVEDDGQYELYQNLCEETESVDDFKESLQNLCGLMLAVHDSQVHLIHQTAREYLIGERFWIEQHQATPWQGPVKVVEAHVLMAKSCLSMLALKDFSQPHPWKGQGLVSYEIEAIVVRWARPYDFLNYAATHWTSHAQDVGDAESQSNLGTQMHLCDASSNVFWAWYPLFYRGEYSPMGYDGFNGLVFASSIGHERLVRRYLASGVDINAPSNPRYGSALQAASEGGHCEIVQLLLDAGADVNAEGGYFGSALQAASFRGSREIVELLLDTGADVDALGGFYDGSLRLAILGGFHEISQLLLERGANPGLHG